MSTTSSQPVPEIVVIPTGAANTASVLSALRRKGASVRLSTDNTDVMNAPGVVLPGVGAFGPAMRMLAATGLDDCLRNRIDANRPTMCICLGLQLLAAESEESPGVSGLGVFDTSVQRFDETRVPVPQLGWNRISPEATCTMLMPGPVYFANSFRLTNAPARWKLARADYAGSFIAGAERGNVLACQFHPELSGRLGASMIESWLMRVAEGAPC